jgi:hypothetical protein
VKRRREKERIFTDPATQDSIYFPNTPSEAAAMIVRSRPIDLPQDLVPSEILFNVLANIIHEDDHHVSWRARGYSGRPEEDFTFEFHGARPGVPLARPSRRP